MHIFFKSTGARIQKKAKISILQDNKKPTSDSEPAQFFYPGIYKIGKRVIIDLG